MATDEKNGHEDKYIPGVAYEDGLNDCFAMDFGESVRTEMLLS